MSPPYARNGAVPSGATALPVAGNPQSDAGAARTGAPAQSTFGFLTAVAGTCVLGSEMAVIVGAPTMATVLLLAGGVLWLALTYTIFTVLTIKPKKPTLAEGINGGWLLAVVATQSIAVLIALLSTHWHQPLRLHATFIALSMGMYAVATYRMAHAMSLEFLDFIPHIFFWIALAAWLLAFTGMARTIARVVR